MKRWATAVEHLVGVDPRFVLNMLDGQQTAQAPIHSAPGPQPRDEKAVFVSKVLASTEDTWGDIFSNSGAQYQKPTLVLFSNAVESACGMAASTTGPSPGRW